MSTDPLVLCLQMLISCLLLAYCCCPFSLFLSAPLPFLSSLNVRRGGSQTCNNVQTSHSQMFEAGVLILLVCEQQRLSLLMSLRYSSCHLFGSVFVIVFWGFFRLTWEYDCNVLFMLCCIAHQGSYFVNHSILL